MNKNSKSVKHAKAVLKYWDKPFCTCLLKYIDELEKKAYKCEYYKEHADIFYQELTEIREDNSINEFIIEKIKNIIGRESRSTFDNMDKLRNIKNLLGG